jgi:hypothetical protein
VVGGVDHGVPRVLARGDVVLDLVDQDHGVADDHAGQRDRAEDRHETHGRMGRQ